MPFSIFIKLIVRCQEPKKRNDVIFHKKKKEKKNVKVVKRCNFSYYLLRSLSDHAIMSLKLTSKI